LIERYNDNFYIHPLVLYLEHVYETLAEAELRRYHYASYIAEGYRISYHIPFSGDNRLLYLYPSNAVSEKYEVDDIIKTDDSVIRTIVFSLEFTKDELDKKITPDFKSEEFLRAFRRYIDVIDEINKEVEAFNAGLPDLVINALTERKRRVDNYIAFSKTLNIPLERNPNAPNTIPIPLTKIKKEEPLMPGPGQPAQTYAISDADYINIRRIINFAGFSMEKTAATFNKLDEESLRNVIVAFLNTHYLGTATGETFCKTGRADIHILFENKAAYIAECKVWDSVLCLKAAIEQLFNYTTWRDVKTSVIIFNKNLKHFQQSLSTIDDYLRKNALCHNIKLLGENEWLCEFKQSEDAEDYITIHIIMFNLFLRTNRSKAKPVNILSDL